MKIQKSYSQYVIEERKEGKGIKTRAGKEILTLGRKEQILVRMNNRKEEIDEKTKQESEEEKKDVRQGKIDRLEKKVTGGRKD